MRRHQVFLSVPPLVAGGSKMYLGCVWEGADRVAQWAPDQDPPVRGRGGAAGFKVPLF